MQEFSVIDESFDKTLTTSYFISIQFSLDGFSFCTLDPIQNLYIQFKHFSFEKDDNNFLKSSNLLHSEPLLKYNYKKAFVLFQTDESTLIPTSLYKKEMINNFIDITFNKKTPSTTKKTAFATKIKMADAYNICRVNQDLIEDLKKRFKTPTFLHASTPFIESNLMEDLRHFDPNHTHLHLFFFQKSFHIIITQKRQLTLSNTFKYSNENEIIYYLYFIFDQLKLDPNKTSITAAGNILNKKKEIQLLKKYIARLIIEKPEKHFNFSPVFKPVSISQYTNLFNAPICV
ncbi:MAG: DUF3822 family protein [Marinilabiliaceae bacterium]|nr:DUF3822 family protein [Marinilabiliaceae bacterium]